MTKAALEQEIDRSTIMEGFIENSSWNGSKIVTLKQDVSVRKFFRLILGDKTAILMDARPPLEDTAMFEFMRNKFDKLGLSVPEIYETDHENGFVIMEDFGDVRCYELITETRTDLNEVYSACIDTLAHKYFADPEIALEQSVAYSDDYWLFRIEQFLLHYMPQVVGREPTEDERNEFLNIFKKLIGNAHKLDNVLLHGDFGIQNLYYKPERGEVKSIAIIDFQDMTDARGNMMGSPAFDLAFLLQDVRTSVSDELEQEMKKSFIEKVNFSDEQIELFNSEYAIIATAQSVKCLGLFARLGYVDGRKEYLQFISNCILNLRRNLVNPELKELKAWFTKANVEI